MLIIYFLRTVPILPHYLYRIDHANMTGKDTDLAGDTPIMQQIGNISDTSPFSSSNRTKNSSDSDCPGVDGELDNINIKVGLLLASKSTMQLIINPFIGRLTDRLVILIF